MNSEATLLENSCILPLMVSPVTSRTTGLQSYDQVVIELSPRDIDNHKENNGHNEEDYTERVGFGS